MRFAGAPPVSTPASCSTNSKMDIVGSPYYMAQSAAYFRSPSNNSTVVASNNNGIHSFPTPPPTMPTYYDTKCLPLPGL